MQISCGLMVDIINYIFIHIMNMLIVPNDTPAKLVHIAFFIQQSFRKPTLVRIFFIAVTEDDFNRFDSYHKIIRELFIKPRVYMNNHHLVHALVMYSVNLKLFT